MSAPALTRPTAPPAHRGPERRAARQRARAGEGHARAASRSTSSWWCRSWRWPRRPGRLGLGAVLARRRPRGRLLLPHAARRHGRLPPALHARLVQGEPAAARRAGRRRRHGRSRARSSSGWPTTAGTTPSPTARATRTRRGATAPTPAQLAQGHVPRPPRLAVRPPADQRRALRPRPAQGRRPSVAPAALFIVWAFLSLRPARRHRRAGHRRAGPAPGRRSSGPGWSGSRCCTT